jgi:hypothetical protein
MDPSFTCQEINAQENVEEYWGHTFFGHFEGENGFPKSLADVFLEACVYPICPC